MNDLKVSTSIVSTRELDTNKGKLLPQADRQGLVSVNQSPTATGHTSQAKSVQEAQSATEEQLLDKQETLREQVEQAVAQLNDYVQTVQRDLLFKLDTDSGETVISVIDRSTDEVVRQIPDEVALRLARDLKDSASFELFNTKV
ncbi:flagellar protein FlaG [Zooshikella harenae]|uniref:Flagellar protein FlaG n=1 Tax=Zooshikella harenae TaxID=2827238 RepID=A0ABS5Z8W3_9GAMM|nr:flagellar protein FlaG [Zooshikella harenae]MBU2710483.1 flagellar protein FlaG [Zooshikella harenae]